jgi:phosphoribosylamine--glycine ligase
MKILVIGAGGREHALIWKLAGCDGVSRIFAAPGNPGIAQSAELIPIKASDLKGLVRFAEGEQIDLTVVGPEQPLADGIVDLFERHGLTIFGPTRGAAALESSKAFAKEFMRRHSIPTASYRTFDVQTLAEARAFLATCVLPVVLKADGLAAGKGVIICRTRDEANTALREMMEMMVFGAAGAKVVVEEYMEGEEASVFAVCDGKDFLTLAPAQDHKRVFDDDRGKNTGGMGAYAPTPFVTPEILDYVERNIVAPTLRGMSVEGRPYRGCLYVGLMLTKNGPRVVEYNCRFGDPETQVVLPLYDGDFARLLVASCRGDLQRLAPPKGITPHTSYSVCVVLASKGYPDQYPSGLEIRGLDVLTHAPGVQVFHAGTRREDAKIVTAGGRVLGVTAIGVREKLQETIDRAYRAVSQVSFEGMHFRRDIGRKALRAANSG